MKKRFLLLFCTAVLLCGSGCTATQVRDRAYLQAMELQTPQTPTVQLHDFHTENRRLRGRCNACRCHHKCRCPAGKDLFLGHLELIAYQDPAYGAQLDQLMSDYRLSPACKIVGLPDGTTWQNRHLRADPTAAPGRDKGNAAGDGFVYHSPGMGQRIRNSTPALVTADGFSAAVVTKKR
ncbi:MAG: hypothetical protein ACLTXT_06390 [Ruminococcus callidus]